MMSRSGLAHVQALLQANRLIQQHAELQRRRLEALSAIQGQLPPALRDHCRDARLCEGILTLFVDSPAWATRVRFLTDGLARSSVSEDIVKVLVQVRAATDLQVTDDGLRGARRLASSQTRAPRLSDETVAHLLAIADGMPDPTLAGAFRRLAGRRTPAAKAPAGDRSEDASRPPERGGKAAQDLD